MTLLLEMHRRLVLRKKLHVTFHRITYRRTIDQCPGQHYHTQTLYIIQILLNMLIYMATKKIKVYLNNSTLRNFSNDDNQVEKIKRHHYSVVTTHQITHYSLKDPSHSNIGSGSMHRNRIGCMKGIFEPVKLSLKRCYLSFHC